MEALQKPETSVCNKTLIEGDNLRSVKIFKNTAILLLCCCYGLSCRPQFSLARAFDMRSCYSALSNFLRSGRDNNIRRGTLPVSGVYLNNFPFIICITPGPMYAVDMTFKAFQKGSNFLLLDSVF